MAKNKPSPWRLHWIRAAQRRVMLVAAKLPDGTKGGMFLCSQCFHKRRKRAWKNNHWNRSSNYTKLPSGLRKYFGDDEPREYYYEAHDFSNTAKDAKCEDCGFTLKGRT